MVKMNFTPINSQVYVNPIEPPLSGVIAYPEDPSTIKFEPPTAGVLPRW